MYRIGYSLFPKEVQSFIQNSLLDHAKQCGIDLIEIDPTKPLTQQGPFDCIIHKHNGSDWNNQLQQLSLDHPNVVVIDPPQAIEHLHNRVSMLDVVSNLKIPQGNQTFEVPKQRIEELGLKFPLIAKPVSVDGSAKSHEMFFVFNENGLKKLKLKKPIMMQEFVNHSGVIFKVYVVGDHVKCVKRSSLSDIYKETLNSVAEDEGFLLFSKISNLVEKNDEAEGGSSNEVEGYCYGAEKLVEEAKMPPLEFAMGLKLFNFDLIRNSRDGNKYFVIDINYFPGYVNMLEYESIFVDFFYDVVQEKRKKNSDGEVELDVK
ncbi:hypothetical protein ACB092_12G111700 [Castanea dentata]